MQILNNAQLNRVQQFLLLANPNILEEYLREQGADEDSRQYFRAMLHFRLGQTAQAQQELTSLWQRTGNNPLALVFLTEIALHSQNSGDENYYKKLQNLFPLTHEYEQYLPVFPIFHQSHPQQANETDIFMANIKSQPLNGQYWLELCEYLHKRGLNEEILQLWGKMPPIVAINQKILQLIGKITINCGRTEEFFHLVDGQMPLPTALYDYLKQLWYMENPGDYMETALRQPLEKTHSVMDNHSQTPHNTHLTIIMNDSQLWGNYSFLSAITSIMHDDKKKYVIIDNCQPADGMCTGMVACPIHYTNQSEAQTLAVIINNYGADDIVFLQPFAHLGVMEILHDGPAHLYALTPHPDLPNYVQPYCDMTKKANIMVPQWRLLERDRAEYDYGLIIKPGQCHPKLGIYLGEIMKILPGNLLCVGIDLKEKLSLLTNQINDILGIERVYYHGDCTHYIAASQIILNQCHKYWQDNKYPNDDVLAFLCAQNMPIALLHDKESPENLSLYIMQKYQPAGICHNLAEMVEYLMRIPA